MADISINRRSKNTANNLEGLPEKLRDNLGISPETGISTHYFNQIASIIMQYDILHGRGWSSEQIEKAKLDIPRHVKEMLSYKDFLAKQVEVFNYRQEQRYKTLKEEFGKKPGVQLFPPKRTLLEDIIGVLITPENRADELDRIGHEMKLIQKRLNIS